MQGCALYVFDCTGLVAFDIFGSVRLQVLFVGGSGGILVQSTLASLGYEVELIELAAAEIPVAVVALIAGCAVTLLNDKKLT